MSVPNLNTSLAKMAARFDPVDNLMGLNSGVGTGQLNQNLVAGRNFHTVIVSGTFTATLQVNVSIDNVNWAPAVASITAPGIYTFYGSVQFVRVDTTAYTSGTPTVTIRSQLT